MQFERFYSLNDSVVGSFPHFIIYDFSQLSQIWGNLCGGNVINVLSYAHPQLFNAMVEQERLEDDGIGDELMEMQEILWPIKRL